MHHVVTTEFYLQFHNGAKLFEELTELFSPYIEDELIISHTNTHILEIFYTSIPLQYLEEYVIPFVLIYNKMTEVTGKEITIHY